MIKIIIDNCVEVFPGIWTAHLADPEVASLGKPERAQGTHSVVLLSEKPLFDPGRRSLTFPLDSARLVNRGSTREVVLIATTPNAVPPPAPSSNGDQQFLDKLPADLHDLGLELLRRIRAEYPGELRFHPASEKFVESPDNFFTIRIQPRDKSLRITVRGLPDRFPPARTLVLRKDMTSYSAFKVSSIDQIDEAMQVLRSADRRRKP